MLPKSSVSNATPPPATPACFLAAPHGWRLLPSPLSSAIALVAPTKLSPVLRTLARAVGTIALDKKTVEKVSYDRSSILSQVLRFGPRRDYVEILPIIASQGR